jgi:hypothetical protein
VDEQPAKVTMRTPDGGFVMVLERDVAAFEAAGYGVTGTYRATKDGPVVRLELTNLTDEELPLEAFAGPTLTAPAVEAKALVKPDRKPRVTRARKAG